MRRVLLRMFIAFLGVFLIFGAGFVAFVFSLLI